MAKVVPCLTLDGFIDLPSVLMERLWVYFLTSAYSQSNIFKGTIKSFRYIIGTFKTEVSIKEEMENALRELYAPYFTMVNVTVTVADYLKNGRLHLIIDLYCGDDKGNVYTLNKSIDKSIGNFNNYEEEIDRLYAIYKGDPNGQ